MKLNFNVQLLDLEGETFNDDKKQPLTLRRVCVDALGNALPGDENLNGETKYKLYALADRIVRSVKANKECEISAEEISTLKERIAKSWTTLVMGPAFDLLEKKNEVAAEQEGATAE